MNTSKVYTVIHTHHTLEVLKSTSKKVFWDILKILYLIGCLYSKSKVFWHILKILYLIGCLYSKLKVLVISEKKKKYQDIRYGDKMYSVIIENRYGTIPYNTLTSLRTQYIANLPTINNLEEDLFHAQSTVI